MKEWTDYELREIDDKEKRAEVCGVPADEVRKGIKAIMLTKPIIEARQDAQKVLERGKLPIIYFTENGNGGMRKKTYITNVEGKVPTNYFPYTEVGHSDEATRELKEIFGGKSPFNTPKPTRLLERILDIATDDDSIILDSFAGSGTTAHAVLLANQKKHSHKKFILVELMDYADTTTAYRVKKAMTGYKATMKHEEEIYSKKLTIKNLTKVETFLKEAETVIEKEQGKYAEISKPKLQDNCIKVIASRVADGFVEGLGGSFDYYELGKPLFKEDNNLNEEVGEDKIRNYIYYTETKQPLTRMRENGSYLLDTLNGTSYYFYYEKDRLTNLSLEDLSIVTEKAEQYIIYADTCTIDEQTRAKLNIIFKKIPRDIRRF